MIKKTLFVLFILINISVFAQKRNNLQLIGFGFDQWSEYYIPLESLSPEVGRYSYIVGYQRLIGSKLSLGLTFNYLFGLKDEPVSGYYEYSYAPKYINGYEFDKGNYTLNAYSIGYESKYYFEEFDEDGANAFYLGFNYQYTNINETINEVTYRKISNASDTQTPTFEEMNYGINKLGLKVGKTATGTFTSDFAIGMYLNMPTANKDLTWKSPTIVNSLSFNITWLIGIPF